MSEKHDICPVPYHQVFIQSSGRVYPCAFLQNHTLLGDIKDKTLKEVWNGPERSQFLRDHEAGEFLQCSRNQQTFSCHKSLGINLPIKTKSDLPNRLDFMIDSFCNLRCIMCTNVYEESGGFEKESFWENFEKEILPEVSEIEFIGGEPLLVENTFKAIDLIKKVKPDIKIKITTNGSFRFSEKMKKALNGLNLTRIGYSIDSLKEDVFSLIRPGGKLSIVLDTLEGFIQLRDNSTHNFLLDVNVVVQKLNAYEIPTLLEFITKKDLTPYLIFLNYPLENSLLNLEEEEQARIMDFYFNDISTRGSQPELVKILIDFYKKTSPENRLRFSEHFLELRKNKKS